MTSEKLSLFQFYFPKTEFDNKYVWKYAPMHMIFDVDQKDLIHKARIVIVWIKISIPYIHLPSNVCP